jgi:hypothetical protein
MKKIILNSILLVFIFYWLCTFLYVSPNNYIKISLLEEMQTFNTFFFQKWGFFAPPPKFNDRLYYTFESKKDSTISYTFEVMEPLQKRKSSKAPFNSSENILDYVLSSTVHSISDGLLTVNKAIDYQVEVSDTIKSSTELKRQKGKEYVQTTSSYKTLIRYAKYVAKKNNINNLKNFSLVIEVVQLNIPKFADRNNIELTNVKEEGLIFKSDKINFQ